MIFYYDPILGLQYTAIEIFCINIDAIPKVSFKKMKQIINEVGFLPINTNSEPRPEFYEEQQIYTNAL